MSHNIIFPLIRYLKVTLFDAYYEKICHPGDPTEMLDQYTTFLNIIIIIIAQKL